MDAKKMAKTNERFTVPLQNDEPDSNVSMPILLGRTLRLVRLSGTGPRSIRASQFFTRRNAGRPVENCALSRDIEFALR